MSSQAFKALLRSEWPELADEKVEWVGRYRDLVLEASKVQNLTKLLRPEDFYFGHVRDCQEILKSGLVQYPAADLGSGVGVPGLLCAILEEKPWVLLESEIKKAEFLSHAVSELGLGHVKVLYGRAEQTLDQAEVGSVVARAVGTVDRIYGWIRECSTWNNLILLKGPRWETEWKNSMNNRQLQEAGRHTYSVRDDVKRHIVKLNRV